jgi:adenylosuccinate synthase
MVRMSARAIVGMQFGDEGKGKIVDYLASASDMVVRFQGGSNAGHTVVVNGKTYKFHLVPSGVLHGKISVIATGVVLDPAVLVEEMEHLEQNGYDTSVIRVSRRAYLVLPYHREMDAWEEGLKGDVKVGTTRRGIGPAYEDRAARIALRVHDLESEEKLRRKLRLALRFRRACMGVEFGEEEILEQLKEQFERFRDLLCDSEILVNRAIDSGREVLFEGAQGTFLDVDHGTYPFVTSSSTIAGGACTGAGVPPWKVCQVLGVAKAYTTRVGEGPLPTEIEGGEAERLRERGGEFGATTGRPRRVGWLDLPLLRYAALVNGVKEIALTKVDVLAGRSTIPVATAYRVGGREVLYPPPDLEGVEPVYVEMEGWSESEVEDCLSGEIPEPIKEYVALVEKATSARVTIISLGKDREKTVVL